MENVDPQQESLGQQAENRWARMQRERDEEIKRKERLISDLNQRIAELKAKNELPAADITVEWRRWGDFPEIHFRVQCTAVDMDKSKLSDYLREKCQDILNPFWKQCFRAVRVKELRKLKEIRAEMLSDKPFLVYATLFERPPKDNLKALRWVKKRKRKGLYWNVPGQDQQSDPS